MRVCVRRWLLPVAKRAAPVSPDTSSDWRAATFGAVRGAAQLLGAELSPADTRNAGDIERGVAAFAHSANGGLIVMPGARASVHGGLIIALATRYKLPAIYPFRYHATAGGLICYGADYVEAFGPQPTRSTASSRAKSPRTCRCKRRPSTN
jgi:putative tryptophan/tyrosine transport system substrate-binding protein